MYSSARNCGEIFRLDPLGHFRHRKSDSSLVWEYLSQFGTNLQSGDIIEWKEAFLDGSCREKDLEYGFKNIRLDYANNPLTTETITRGKTHVAVGFNDLLFLLKARFEGEANGWRFIAIDASPYSVAKSLVIWEMLQNPDVPLCCVMEVWYSATWHQETLDWFTKVLCVVWSHQHTLFLGRFPSRASGPI